MNISVLLLVLCASAMPNISSHNIFSTHLQWCNIYEDVTQEFRYALYRFTADAYRKVASKGVFHFVYSPLSTWINLAAIAEGADLATKQRLFEFLRLPLDPCIRLKYYHLATSRYTSSYDVDISNIRALVIDEGVAINPIYHNFVYQNSLLDVVSAPLRDDPQTALKELRRVTSAKLENIDLNGNSVIIEAVDYSGLWSTAFEDAVVERSPFYSKSGESTGTVDLMRIRKRAKMTHLKSINAKAIELPIGFNDRYRMLFAILLDSNIAETVGTIRSSIIDEYLNSVQDSYLPIDIAIPRINVTSEYDLKKILEDFGIKDLWTDPSATGYISQPAALPSGFVHSSTITLNKAGLETAPARSQYPHKTSTGLDQILAQEFIANRPFIFGLFDAETFTCILAAAFTQPTYTY